MVRFTLKQLEYYSAVADQGGIAQAARVLNISQPSVASALGKLEASVGVRLLSRHHAKGVELTPEGREVLSLARSLLKEAAGTETAFQAMAADVSGHIRLGCFHNLAPLYLPSLVKAIGVRHPSVTLDLTESTHNELIAELIDGAADVALMYDMALPGRSLRHERIKTVMPYVILSEKHPLAEDKAISAKALAREPYVMFDLPGTREYFQSVLQAIGIEPSVTFRSHSFELVRSAVANDLGFSLLHSKPKTDVTYDGNRIVRLPLREAVPSLDIVIAWPRSAHASPLRNRFIDFAKEFFAHLEE